MSFAVAELLAVNVFRQHGWVPAGHPAFFAGGMLAVTAGLALTLHVAVEARRGVSRRWNARRGVSRRQGKGREGFFL